MISQVELRKMVRDACKPKEGARPAVYISGGIDSCIVLHHLRENYDGDIYTFTAKFRNRGDLLERASDVSENYGTLHQEVEITDFVKTLYYVMRYLKFDEPRYNIWPYWLAREAAFMGCNTVYTGEGSDEVFGGYPNKNYLEGWAGQLVYVDYTYKIIHDAFKLELIKPFFNLPSLFDLYGSGYFFPPEKQTLRDAYAGIIPDWIRHAPVQPPAFTQYMDVWERELKGKYEGRDPVNPQDVKDILQVLATDAWNNGKVGILEKGEEEMK